MMASDNCRQRLHIGRRSALQPVGIEPVDHGERCCEPSHGTPGLLCAGVLNKPFFGLMSLPRLAG